MESLLLTGTIQPHVGILKQGYKSTSVDPGKRYFEYMDTLLYYITQSGFSSIVFCENSNYEIRDKEMLYSIAELYWKNIEILQFEWDHEKTVKQGYGYWEGECIDYAVDNSETLKKARNWYKCSGRYKIVNIDTIMRDNADLDLIFSRWTMGAFFFSDTAYFKTTSEFYRKHLYNLKEKVDHSRLLLLEVCFYDTLRLVHKENNIGNFKGVFIRKSYSKGLVMRTRVLKFLWLIDYGVISDIIDSLLYNKRAAYRLLINEYYKENDSSKNSKYPFLSEMLRKIHFGGKVLKMLIWN